MVDVPRPAPEPYSPGDQVRIYLDPADPDAHTHGTVCKITNVLEDDLDTETGRPTDAYSYRLRELETDAESGWLFATRTYRPQITGSNHSRSDGG